LDQRTKAESDPAVSAASILARARFIDWLAKASLDIGLTLPKGASALVREQGMVLVRRDGPEALGKVAKLHFKTAAEILSSNFTTQILHEKPE
jgi:ribonuclease HIII